MSFIQLRVRLSVVFEETGDIFRILYVFVVAKKEEILLKLLDYKLLLSFVVVYCLRIDSLRSFFKLVGLCGCMPFRDHLFNSPFCVCTVEVFEISHKAHDISEFGLWIIIEVFKSNKQRRHFPHFCVVHDTLEPALKMFCAVPNPPVPPFWVLLLVVEWGFAVMVG